MDNDTRLHLVHQSALLVKSNLARKEVEKVQSYQNNRIAELSQEVIQLKNTIAELKQLLLKKD